MIPGLRTHQQGLSRTIVQAEKAALMVQEAAVVAELPLPPEMQHLEQIFQALNAVHSFLLSAHIQVRMASCPASIAEEAVARKTCVLSHLPNVQVKFAGLGPSEPGWSAKAWVVPAGNLEECEEGCAEHPRRAGRPAVRCGGHGRPVPRRGHRAQPPQVTAHVCLPHSTQQSRQDPPDLCRVTLPSL